VITGQAPSLVYVFINGQNVEMRAADHLRGKTPDETHSIIRSEPGCSTVWWRPSAQRVRIASASPRSAMKAGTQAVAASAR